MNKNPLISFDEIDEAIAQDDEAKVTRSIAQATRVENPDQYAHDLALAEQTGLPMDTIGRNKAEVMQKKRLSDTDIQAIFNDAPAARKWLADKDNAALVSDDFSTVGQLKKALGDIPESWNIGLDTNELVNLRSIELAGGTLSPEQAARASGLGDEAEKKTGTGGWFSDAVNMTARTLPQVGYSVAAAAKGGMQGAMLGGSAALVVGQMGPQVATPEEVVTVPAAAMLGAGYGATVGATFESYRQQSALAYDQLLRMRDDNGNALEPDIAKGAAIGIGVLAAPLDAIGLGKLANTIPGVAALRATLTKEGIKKVLENQGARQAFARIGQRFASGVTTEGITEAAQEVISIMGEEIAKANSEGEFKATTAGEALERTGQAFRGGALVGGTIGAPGTAAGVALELRRSRNTTPEQVAAHVDAINDAVKSSKLYQRSPQRFHSLATDLAGDERFYINGKAALDMVASLSNEDQSRLFSALPDLRDELEVAALSDATDVSIKKADYAAYIAPLSSAGKLRDYIKLDPQDLSLAEKKEAASYIEKNPEAAARFSEQEQNAPNAESELAVERIVRKAMQDAGRSVAESRSVAPLFSKAMTRFAAPFGEQATDMLNRMQLRFQQVGEDGRAFSAGSNIDVMLRDLSTLEAGGQVTGLNDAGREALAAFGKRLDEAGISTQEAIKLGSEEVGRRLNPAGESDVLNQDEKNLLVQHNIKATGLKNVEKLGGLPVPSLAVSSKDAPLEGFGEITLLAKSDLVDPQKNKTSKVFGADVYSPRYPTVQYEVDYKKIRVLNDELEKYAAKVSPDSRDWWALLPTEDKVSEKGARAIEESPAVAVKYLEGRGIALPEPERYADGKVAFTATGRKIVDAARAVEGYADYTESVAANVIKNERIFDGFTPSGNRKYLAHNLDNVVKILKRNLRDGEGFNYGVGSIRSKYVKQFRNLKQIMDSRKKVVSNEAFESIKKQTDETFMTLAEKWRPYSPWGNEFGFLDTFSEHLKEAADTNLNAVNREYYKSIIPDELLQETAAFLNVLRDMPTEYFEAKIQRAVQLQEFEAAVVPDGADYDESAAILKKRGLIVERYDAKQDGARKAAISRVNEQVSIFFQQERGSIELDKALRRVVVSFTSRANLSTAAHEFSHFGVAMHRNFAELARARIALGDETPELQRIVDDWETLKEAVGASGGWKKNKYSGLPYVVTKIKGGEEIALFYDKNPDGPMVRAVDKNGNTIGELDITGEARDGSLVPGGDVVAAWQRKGVYAAMHDLVEAKLGRLANRKDIVLTGDGAAFWDNRDAGRAGKTNFTEMSDWEARNNSNTFTVEQEEKLARMFESYLREGQAPSEGLRSVFSRFMEWMTAIYKDIKALGDPLNPEVAGVFDRWLASQEEIDAAAQKDASLADIAAELGLGGDVERKIADYLESAKNSAAESLYRKLTREQKRLQSDGYRQEFDRVREGVVAEFKRQPVFASLDFLKDNSLRVYVGEKELVHEDFFAAPDVGETATLADYEYLLQAEKDATEAREHAIKVMLAPRPKKPLTLFKAIRAHGGLNEKALKGDLKALGVTGKLAQSLNRKKGLSLDYMREALVQDGWLSADADINTLLDLIGQEASGREVVHPNDADLVMQWEALDEADRIVNEMGIDLEAERFARRGLGNYPWAFTLDRSDPQAVSADEVAELHGYESGSELLRAMRTAPQFDRAVNAETRTRLLDMYPDMIIDGRIKVEAVKAITNDRTLLALDLMIKEMGGGAGVNMRQFSRMIAQQRIAKMKIGETSYAFRHEVARQKALRDALKAARAGNPDEAVKQLQNAMVSHSIYKGLERIADKKQKAEILFKRVNQKDKTLADSADIDFIGAARHILSRYELATSNFDYTRWLADLKERNPEVVDDIGAFIDAADAQPKPAKELTTQEFLDIYNAVQNLFHAARKMREFQLGEESVAMQEVVGELVEQFGTIKAKPTTAGTQIYGKARFHQNLSALKALQRRVEHWVESIDGGYGGPARRFIWQPISDAAVKYRAARAQWMEKLHAILVESKDLLSERGKVATGMFKADGSELVLRDRQELIGFLLHTGNESNLDKLLGGYGISPDNYLAAIKKMQMTGVLTKKDYQLVQKLWDLAEDLKPLSQAAHKQLYGYRFEEIESAPVATEFGVFRGGYWPAVVDREQVDMLQPEDPRFLLATTTKGFTKSRVKNFRKPLSTNLRLASSHIDQVLRFSYLEGAIRNANRLTNDANLKAGLRAIDPAAISDMIRPWLDRTARQVTAEPVNGRGDSLLGTGARYLRRSASMQTMMGNLANAVQNYTGLSVAMYRVGPRNFAKAFAQYSMSPSESSETVRALSVFMRERHNTFDNDVTNEISEIVLREGYFKKIQHAAVKHGYIFQRITQGQVDNITWMAAYSKALEDGMGEAEAVKYSDSAVRMTQSSGAPEDISKIEAGSELGKPLLMFYSYFNTVGNLVGTEATKIMNEAGWAGTPRLFYLYLMTVSIPAVVGDLIGRAIRDDLPGDDDDDGEVLDDWLTYVAGTQFRFMTAAIPYLGQAINAALNSFNKRPFDDRITASPVISQAETTVRFISKEIKGGYNDKSQEVRDGLNAIGFVTGLPLGQLGKPAGFLADVAEGDAQPEGVSGYARGFAGGPAAPR